MEGSYHYRALYLYAYNLLTVIDINLIESCKKANGVSAEKIQKEIFHCFEIFLQVCMYVFIYHW